MLNLLWIRERSLKWYSFPSKVHILSKNFFIFCKKTLELGEVWFLVETKNMVILSLRKNNIKIHFNYLRKLRKFLLNLGSEKLFTKNSKVKNLKYRQNKIFIGFVFFGSIGWLYELSEITENLEFSSRFPLKLIWRYQKLIEDQNRWICKSQIIKKLYTSTNFAKNEIHFDLENSSPSVCIRILDKNCDKSLDRHVFMVN